MYPKIIFFGGGGGEKENESIFKKPRKILI